jgi:two-component system, cell cycle response regulator
MRVKIAARHMDTVMLANAATIAVACLLVLLVLFKVYSQPTRHGEDLALTLIATTSDVAGGEDLSGLRLDLDGVGSMLGRLAVARDQVKALNEAASFEVFLDHPLFAAISAKPEEMRQLALAEARAGSAFFARFETIDGTDYLRLFAPMKATGDCLSCISSGLPSFSRGDIIGVREIRYPLQSSLSASALLLALALLMLVVALAVFILIIIPFIRQNRMEKAQIHNLAATLEVQASTDPLTGLNNRRYFENALQQYLVEFNRTRSPLGLLVFDLDHFKKVNDTHGHDAGDMVLREVALRLRAITRDNDVVARIGGEEFAVITPFANREQLMAVAERYRTMISALNVNVGKVVLKPTISIGVATNETGVRDASELFKAADQKLYEAKRDGRNRVAA